MKSSELIHADAPPDILARLHTLRAYADDVKNQADDMGLLQIATLCASVRETATEAIELHNGKLAACKCGGLCPACANTPHVETQRVG